MTVVRLCTRQYFELDGIGASKTGGRWNSKGKSVVYTASCTALAILEALGHMSQFPRNLLLLTIEIPATLKCEEILHLPAETNASQQLGDEWLVAGQSPILSVPSVVAPGQRNYLLNPAHTLFQAIQLTRTQPFAMDWRLVAHLSPEIVGGAVPPVQQ
jgi:RES domain-containing protein